MLVCFFVVVVVVVLRFLTFQGVGLSLVRTALMACGTLFSIETVFVLFLSD